MKAFPASILGGAAILVMFAYLCGTILMGVTGASVNGNPAAANSCDMPIPGAPLDSSKVPAEYAADLESAAKESGVPAPVLAGQIRAESNWNPRAASAVGARGIAQFMPATWASFGGGKDIEDPHAGILAQGRFMGTLMQQAKAAGIKGDPVDLALAGYNAGWGAVVLHGGIPAYPETQNYVARIHEYANGYAAAAGAKGAASTVVSKLPACVAGVAAISGTDDYPFRDLPHCLLTSDGQYGGCPAGSESTFGAFHGECVDFVMWRLNQELGAAKEPWKITNSTFRPDGLPLGNARDYLGAWMAKGWPTGHTPKVGAVVYFAGGHPATGAQPYGHVAIVREVRSDGTYVEEGYNFGLPPNDHKYYTTVRANNVPTAFLYVPGTGQ